MLESGGKILDPKEVVQSETSGFSLVDRRVFLKRVAGMLGMHLSKDSLATASALTNSQSENSFLKETESYIGTDYIKLELKGWKLIAEMDALEQFTRDSKADVEIIINGGYKKDPPRVECKNGKLLRSNDFSWVIEDGVTIGEFEVLPSPINEDAIVNIRESKDGEVKIHSSMVKLVSYMAEMQDPSDRSSVLSEVDITQPTLNKMQSLAADFDIFGQGAFPVFVLDANLSFQSAITDMETAVIKIPSKYFQNQEYVGAGMIVLQHELLHSIHSSVVVGARDEDEALSEEHQELWRSLTQGKMSSEKDTYGMGVPNNISKNIAFVPFDESTYFFDLRKVDAIDIGHPFSNYRELFASGMNCMIHEALRVINEVEKIDNPEGHEQAVRFGRRILELAYALAERGTEGSGKEIVLSKFQNLRDVSEYFGA